MLLNNISILNFKQR